jgi:hypothetical protein
MVRARGAERRSTRLRAAGGRILDRVLGHGALVAAERLGQATLEDLRCIKDVGGDPGRLLLVAIAPEAPGDDGVVKGPDRPQVIADRVVSTLALSERPDTPTRVQPWRHEVIDDHRRFGCVDDATPQEVTDIRRERIDLAPVGVQGEGVVAAVREPVVAVEAMLELGCLLLQALRERLVLPDEPREPGTADLGVVRVPL